MVDIDVEVSGNSAVCSVVGSLDTEAAVELRAALLSLAQGDDVLYIVFDMAECDYLASASMRVILNVFKAQHVKGGTVEMRNVQPDVLNVISMTGIHRLIKVS